MIDGGDNDDQHMIGDTISLLRSNNESIFVSPGLRDKVSVDERGVVTVQKLFLVGCLVVTNTALWT